MARPLPDTISDETKKIFMCNRDDILCSVKNHIDENLNPKKQNILTPRKENFVVVPTISDILQQLNITPEDYYNALFIFSDNDFQIHLKRQPNECFINNCFLEGLQTWKAILIFSLYSIIIRQLLICVVTFQ